MTFATGLLPQLTPVQIITYSANAIQSSIYFLSVSVKYSCQHPAKVETLTRLVYFARKKIPALLCSSSGFNIHAWFWGQMDHKTKCIGYGGVVFLMLCWGEKRKKEENKKKKQQQPTSLEIERWSQLSWAIEEPCVFHHAKMLSWRNIPSSKLLARTIYLDMEVGIVDRQDAMGLCSLLHPLDILFLVFLTVLAGKATIMKIECEAKRVWKDLHSMTHLSSQCRKHAMSSSIGTHMSPRT